MNRVFDWSVTRRGLLRVAGILGGSLVAGSGCREPDEATCRDKPPGENIDSPLHRAIREHFAYLSIDDPVITEFAMDLERHQGSWNPETSPRPYTRFLASTDFFQNGADESRPLVYVAFYDPYANSCYNPFGSATQPRSEPRG